MLVTSRPLSNPLHPSQKLPQPFLSLFTALYPAQRWLNSCPSVSNPHYHGWTLAHPLSNPLYPRSVDIHRRRPGQAEYKIPNWSSQHIQGFLSVSGIIILIQYIKEEGSNILLSFMRLSHWNYFFWCLNYTWYIRMQFYIYLHILNKN